jgi:uncharacterized protein
MRRTEREITERSAMDDIIRRSKVCHIAMCDGNQPYLVPMNFGYDGKHIFLHGADKGRKLDVLKKNAHVCFEFEIVGNIRQDEKACGWGIEYESVIGFGHARFLENMAEKKRALGVIMRQYSERDWTFPDQAVSKTLVMRIDIGEMTGKRSKHLPAVSAGETDTD